MAELIMGFDFGTSKIGLAVGQKLTATASPLGKVSAKNGKPDWQQMDSIIKDWEPSLFVVGLPLNWMIREVTSPKQQNVSQDVCKGDTTFHLN